jgi:hypothetical protein
MFSYSYTFKKNCLYSAEITPNLKSSSDNKLESNENRLDKNSPGESAFQVKDLLIEVFSNLSCRDLTSTAMINKAAYTASSFIARSINDSIVTDAHLLLNEIKDNEVLGTVKHLHYYRKAILNVLKSKNEKHHAVFIDHVVNYMLEIGLDKMSCCRKEKFDRIFQNFSPTPFLLSSKAHLERVLDIHLHLTNEESKLVAIVDEGYIETAKFIVYKTHAIGFRGMSYILDHLIDTNQAKKALEVLNHYLQAMKVDRSGKMCILYNTGSLSGSDFIEIQQKYMEKIIPLL